MKNSKRSKTAKRAKSKAGGVTIGLLGFEKISA